MFGSFIICSMYYIIILFKLHYNFTMLLSVISSCVCHAFCSRKWAVHTNHEYYAFYNNNNIFTVQKSTGPKLIHEGKRSLRWII